MRSRPRLVDGGVSDYAGAPAARARTSSVLSGLPPMPQSPLWTSSITTQVTPRMFSPSIETDGAQQRFVSVALELQRWLAPHRELSGDARGELEGVLTELRTGLAELRGLARGLHPAVLTDRGLERALTTLADHATVPVELRVALPRPRLAMSVEAAAYFTVCEALTNVAKHARATRAWVKVEQLDGHLGVEVGDDGAGGADRLAGSGLQGFATASQRSTEH